MKNQKPLRTFFFLDLFGASSGRFVFSKGPFDLRKSMSWTASPWFYHLGNHQWINAWKLKLLESYGKNQQISLESGIHKQNPWKREKLTTDIKKVWLTGHPRLMTKMVSTALSGDSIPRRGKSLPSTTSIFNLRGQVENSWRIWTKVKNVGFWNLTFIVVWGPQLHVKKQHSHRALVAFQMLSNCRVSFQQLYKIIRTHEIPFL